MKKFTLLFVLLSSLTTLKAQTIVSGGIYTNTTWTLAGSPYIIKDTVVVFQSIKLTIQPGVIVKFDSNALIEVWGALYAAGTSADSIIFTSNSATPYAGIYQGITTKTSSDTVTFRYCRFSFATIAFFRKEISTYCPPISHCLITANITGLENNGGPGPWGYDTCVFTWDTNGVMPSGMDGNVISCEFRHNYKAIASNGNSLSMITTSVFENNSYGIYLENIASAPNIISHCIFDSNNEAIATATCLVYQCNFKYNLTAVAVVSAVKYCDISYNGVGVYGSGVIEMNNISNNAIGLESAADTILCNAICNNTTYNFKAIVTTNAIAKDNYWCLPDSASIQATIYDAYQNSNLGFVFFTPFDTVVCVNPTGQNEITDNISTVKVFPNPSTGIFTIALAGAQNFVPTVEVYNLLGEKMYSQLKIDDAQWRINLSGPPNGLYFYRVLNENRSILGSGKVVVQK